MDVSLFNPRELEKLKRILRAEDRRLPRGRLNSQIDSAAIPLVAKAQAGGNAGSVITFNVQKNFPLEDVTPTEDIAARIECNFAGGDPALLFWTSINLGTAQGGHWFAIKCGGSGTEPDTGNTACDNVTGGQLPYPLEVTVSGVTGSSSTGNLAASLFNGTHDLQQQASLCLRSLQIDAEHWLFVDFKGSEIEVGLHVNSIDPLGASITGTITGLTPPYAHTPRSINPLSIVFPAQPHFSAGGQISW